MPVPLVPGMKPRDTPSAESATGMRSPGARGAIGLVICLPRTDQRLAWPGLPPPARPRQDVAGRHRQPVPLGSRSHGRTGRFAHRVTSQDARAYKPRPEMFTAALALLELGPDEVIHVGDSLSGDVAGALRLGIPVAWVNRSRRPAPSAGPRPTCEVSDLRQLLPLLDG